MTWLRTKSAQSLTYWAAVVSLMFSDGDLGRDDLVIFFLALAGWWKLILQ